VSRREQRGPCINISTSRTVDDREVADADRLTGEPACARKLAWLAEAQ
jgi:hypothetical protein